MVLDAMNVVLSLWESCAIPAVRKAALKRTYELIVYEDENTGYQTLGPVSKMMNLLCRFVVEGPDTEVYRQHAIKRADFMWLGAEGLMMCGTNGSQLWDIGFITQALVETGLANEPENKESLGRALGWLDICQIQENPKHYESAYRHRTKGAWPFSTKEQGYTVSDCTGEGLKAVLYLQKQVTGTEKVISDDRLFDAVDTLLTMQNKNGGYASYELVRGPKWLEWLNAAEVFGDIMIEFCYPECTTSVITSLSIFRKYYPNYRTAEIERTIAAAIKWLHEVQKPEGGWFGSWGICFTYATQFALESLALGGEYYANSPAVRRACDFLLSKQRKDGGWGESYKTCEVGYWVDHENTQVVQTCWAAMALMYARYPYPEPIEKAVKLVMSRQLPDGSWPQEAIEGVFNKNCMISYPNFKFSFTIWMLGRAHYYLREQHLVLKMKPDDRGCESSLSHARLPDSQAMAALVVSRIAFLASDVVLYTGSAQSPFSDPYRALVNTSSHQPNVQSVPAGGDPGVSILRYTPGTSLVSLTSTVTSQTALRLVLLATELSSLPLVLHLAIKDDLSDVLPLQSAFLFFLISYTPQEAHDNALLASRLARTEKKAVIHVFYELADGPVVEIAEEDVQPFLLSEKVTVSSNDPGDAKETEIDGVSFVSVGVLAPLSASVILRTIPPSTSRVLVFEQLHRSSTKWTALYLDIVDALQERQAHSQVSIQSVWFTNVEQISQPDLVKLIDTTKNTPLTSPLLLQSETLSSPQAPTPFIPKHESSYTKILSHVFGQRLEISNSPDLVSTQGDIATSPEYALGRVRGQLEKRAQLLSSVQSLMEMEELSTELHRLLAQWLQTKDDSSKSRTTSSQVIAALETSQLSSVLVDRILALKAYFPSKSRWILGSDAWAYDLGSSGLHHIIASGLDINITHPRHSTLFVPKCCRSTPPQARRWLYAMNHGDVYVASIAVYSSYAQVLQAVMEADRHKGPSVILAYLPYHGENSPALDLLKETKLAVDSGYWPLYRWDPTKEARGEEPFTLDSDAVKNDLQQFLDRKNHLSQLVRSKPEIATELVSSLGDTVKEARRRKAQQAYDELLVALDAPPLLVLFASDGGTAEKYAKKLVNRAKARGMSATIGTMDSMTIQSLAEEEYVAFVTSTAGQGEPPQNGRQLFKALNAAALRDEKPFSKLRYSVLALGDSHYWPRPEDAHYYNKPGKDLDARLEKLGGERFVDLGTWEPKVWKALGVDNIQVTEAEPEPITNEHIKAASGYLRGTIAEGLEDTTTGALAPSDTQLTKFHGIYQQDDRDIRDERQAQGVEPAYSFMIRARTPGGVCTPEQWLQMDQISDEHGNGTMKITTRATFQFHGVIKHHLKPSIQKINRVLMDTLAACGDVNRNVTCAAIPSLSRLHHDVYEFSKLVSNHLLPRTTAYHEIWLDKKMVAGEAVKDFEPLYGEFYLPRKVRAFHSMTGQKLSSIQFKVAIAVPPYNDVDVFANDLGFIAIVDEDGELEGFNVAIGGGMGVTHGNKKTYPRIADVIGFCTVEQGALVAEKVMLTQRDNGNRAERKNARLKYTVDRMGLDHFKSEVESRLGFKLGPAQPYTFESNIDHFGWTVGEDGRHHVTIYIENGRVQDEPGREFKTGLREIAKVHKGTFRLTSNQHLVISEVPTEEVPRIKALLAEYKLDNLNYSGLRLSASACVAFPTCGLAMAESERYLPLLIDKVEKICEENGLRHDSIIMRMTGCPNGCARPYIAEIAFVGKAPGSYAMLLGGGYYGQRLNKIYRETVSEPEILAILQPMIKQYALERHEGEHFGDFVIRAGYIAPTTEGKLWYDKMGGEGEHREISVA
ncbi:hypothetical protein JVU11DRAFT_6371 [Chiua virens]|nr:hypothetical protein JVU11DRAFT_6371 [Chiua virens]